MQVKVKVKEKKVNNKIGYSFVYDGKEYQRVEEIIKSNFAYLGDFYKKVLGVSDDESKIAGWRPNHRFIDRTALDGWQQMMKDGGKVEVITKTADIPLIEIVLRANNEPDYLSDFFPEGQK